MKERGGVDEIEMLYSCWFRNNRKLSFMRGLNYLVCCLFCWIRKMFGNIYDIFKFRKIDFCVYLRINGNFFKRC